MHEVRVSQFIYTNVEDHLSPKRRRGLQVWLVSPDLSPTLRAEIEPFLSSFNKPAGSSPNLVRFLFAPLRDGRPPDADPAKYLVAKFTALTKPDRFGRGGRYHAHALVIDPDEFRKLDNNPFRLLEGGFPFQSDPDEVDTKAIPGFSKGEISAVRHVFDQAPETPVPSRFEGVFVPLMRGLVTNATLPLLALPCPHDDVVELLCALVQRLPASARTRATFDTLWTGKGNPLVRFAGAYSGQAFSMWSYRNALKLDPPSSVPAAILESAEGLPEWLDRLLALWARDIPSKNDDRESSLTLGRWLFGAEASSPPPRATRGGVECLLHFPETEIRWKRYVARTIREKIPTPCRTLFDIPTVSEIFFSTLSPWRVESLDSIGKPIALARGNVPIVGHFSKAPRELHEGDLNSLKAWIGHATPDNEEERVSTLQLDAILSRWDAERLPRLLELLRRSSIAGWLRRYCLNTIPEGYRGPTGAMSLMQEMLGPLQRGHGRNQLWRFAAILHAAQPLDSHSSDEAEESGTRGVFQQMGWLLWMEGQLDHDPIPPAHFSFHARWMMDEYLPTLMKHTTPVAVFYSHMGTDATLQRIDEVPVYCGQIVHVFVGCDLADDAGGRRIALLKALMDIAGMRPPRIAAGLLGKDAQDHAIPSESEQKELMPFVACQRNHDLTIADICESRPVDQIRWMVGKVTPRFSVKVAPLRIVAGEPARFGFEVTMNRDDGRMLFCHLIQRCRKDGNHGNLWRSLLHSLLKSARSG